MRKTLLPLSAFVLVTAVSPMPVAAQQADRVLTIYGTDKCPKNAAGEDIVVCVVKPENERYRIPKEFRQSIEIAPTNQSWANRAASIDSLGRTGANSCSTSGPTGWTGCWAQQMRQAKAERKAGLATKDPE